MPSLNFTVFIDKVIAGTKPHSIRAGSRFKVGDDLSLFTAMRTKKCRRLRPNTPCSAAIPIAILTSGKVMLGAGSRFYPKGKLTARQINALALRDGFETSFDFFNFFWSQIPTGENVFRGQLVEWDPSTISVPKTKKNRSGS